MLILASTTDKLQLFTASAGSVHVHASWLDNVAGAVGPGRTNTAAITTATVTDIVGSPASGVFRNIKTLHIHNASASVANVVTVRHTDGTITVELYSGPLLPGQTLQYIDEIGFIASPLAPTFTKVTATNAAWPVPVGIKELTLEVWGGGSSGAGASAGYRGAGGGGGAYVWKRSLGPFDATLNITIGAGGGGVGDAGNGNAGGVTSVVGALLGTLTAGGGQPPPVTGRSFGGPGGAATGGDVNLNGGDGFANAFNANTDDDVIYGFGGDAPRGGMGGKGNVGTPGNIPGGGGAGANHPGGTSSGSGARGEVHIFTR